MIGRNGAMIAAVAMTFVAPADAAPQPAAAVEALVDRFDAARAAFDPTALAATLAGDYVEISPVGAVDSRAAVLGFYAPNQRRPAPPMTHDERVVRVTGTAALVTERKLLTLPNGTVRAIRVGYVARRAGANGGWYRRNTPRSRRRADDGHEFEFQFALFGKCCKAKGRLQVKWVLGDE